MASAEALTRGGAVRGGERPDDRRRVGLFLCAAPCIPGRHVDAYRLAAGFAGAAERIEVLDGLHSAEAWERIHAVVREADLDAVVFAACSPERYNDMLGGRRFLGELEAAGVNPNLVVHANLREHCSLANPGAPPAALAAKARVLVEAALAAVREKPRVEVVEVPPRQRVLVLGVGSAAVSAAYRLLDHGLRVTLIGRGQSWGWTPLEADELALARSTVKRHPLATVLLRTEILDVRGWAGDYAVTLEQDGAVREERFGGILVAVDRDFASFVRLWPLLHVDADLEGRPMGRNRHTMAVRTASPGVTVAPPSAADASDAEHLRQQAMRGAVAALELLGFLRRPFVTHPVTTSRVAPEDCGLCRTCIKVCAFSAAKVDTVAATSVVDEHLCRGCGNCVVACPAGARDLLTSPTDHLAHAIRILSGFRVEGRPQVLAMLCAGCAYRALDNASMQGFPTPLGVLPLEVTCGGRVDTQHVLVAFAAGFDGVVLGCCREGTCHNVVGHLYLDRRVVLLREVLRSRGVDPERLLIMDISPHEGERCATVLTEFSAALEGGRR